MIAILLEANTDLEIRKTEKLGHVCWRASSSTDWTLGPQVPTCTGTHKSSKARPGAVSSCQFQDNRRIVR